MLAPGVITTETHAALGGARGTDLLRAEVSFLHPCFSHRNDVLSARLALLPAVWSHNLPRVTGRSLAPLVTAASAAAAWGVCAVLSSGDHEFRREDGAAAGERLKMKTLFASTCPLW